ncbi:hypothetical protein ACW9UR_18300 [Halovulum sp. GXIMD14794]
MPFFLSMGKSLCYVCEMDLIALIYYAIVCGALGCYAPQIGGFFTRLAVGAAVGVIAALVLPLLRALF